MVSRGTKYMLSEEFNGIEESGKFYLIFCIGLMHKYHHNVVDGRKLHENTFKSLAL